MPVMDPHSFTDSTNPFTTCISLSMFFDFPTTTLQSSALFTLSSPHTGPLVLDTRNLIIHSVLDPQNNNSRLPFSLSPTPDPILGQPLTISLNSHSSFRIHFTTPPSSTALHWLTPAQTSSKISPFVYTQCQSIHARSIFPCQDTPAARIRYSAKLNVPSPLTTAMAAARVSQREPLPNEPGQPVCNELWCDQGRVVDEFAMEQPIPPSLFAFAVGYMVWRDVGPRTRVYAEGGNQVLEMAAREFKGAEEMISAGERLFGRYEWERFDLLVLPPSFPFRRMGNPRLVFLTPTVIKGDASGAMIVAHELACSWTGNLISSKTIEDFWLNEGFSTYVERRLIELVLGEERAALNIKIGWESLNEYLERLKNDMEFTKLKMKLEGFEPDDFYSLYPYEKGFQFIWRIERQIGRPAFDDFLKMYIATFKFQSIDTETFLEFLKINVPDMEKQVDLQRWVEGNGIPPDALEPVSNIYTTIVSLAEEFKNGRIPRQDEVANWHGQEWGLYIENLSKSVDSSQVLALDAQHRLSESIDYDIKVAFLKLAITSGCKAYFGEVEKTLKQVGRMKFLCDLYTALVEAKEDEKILAKRIFLETREFYHPIARDVVESIISMHTLASKY